MKNHHLDTQEIEGEEGKKQNNRNRLNILKYNNNKIKYFHNKVFSIF